MSVSLPELLPLSESAPPAPCELSEHSLSCSDEDSASRSESALDPVPEPEPEPEPESEPESDASEPCDQLSSDASEASEQWSGSAALGLRCVRPGESGAFSARRRLPGIAIARVSVLGQKW